MGDDDGRPLVGRERRLELLDRLQVEVVRRLVEHEAVDAAGLQLGEVRARPLARRERRAGPLDVVGAEVELGEQGAGVDRIEGRARGRRRAAARRRRRRAGAGRASPSTVASPDHAAAAGERELAEQERQQRRLAAAVPPGDRDALARNEVEVDRAEPEAPALGDRALEGDDDRPGSLGRRERELQLPRLVRLLDLRRLARAPAPPGAPSSSSACVPRRSAPPVAFARKPPPARAWLRRACGAAPRPPGAAPALCANSAYCLRRASSRAAA